MTVTDEVVQANKEFAKTFDKGHLPTPPARHLAVLTCMDARLHPEAFLGLDIGHAHVIRNAGGRASDDAIRSLIISSALLGTTEYVVIHHTDCGMLTITDDGFRAELQQDAGMAPAFAIESFTDVDADVRQSILRVRNSPFLPHTDRVRGFVYDVDTHALREVET